MEDLKSKLKKLEGKQWRKRGKWYHSVVYSEICMEGEKTANLQKVNLPFQKQLGVWMPNGDYLDLQEDWQGIKSGFLSFYENDSEYLSKFGQRCLDQGESLISYAKHNVRKDFSNHTDQELVEQYSDLMAKVQEFMPYMTTVHLVDEIITKKFESLLKQYIEVSVLEKKDYFEYQTILALPYRKIFVLEEKQNFFKLVLNENRSEEEVQLHAEKYGWINAVMYEDVPHSVEYYKSKLEKVAVELARKELEKSELEAAELSLKQKELMKELENSDSKLHSISKNLQMFGFLRSFRVDAAHIAIFYSVSLLEEIGRRMKVSLNDMKYVDTHEVRRVLLENDTSVLQAIQSRKENGFLSVFIDQERIEIQDPNLIQYVYDIISYDGKTTNHEDELKGTTAYPGVITGVCRVLTSAKNISKVKTGDILVTSMTDPNYIPAMEKAAAFVTDFGGILCHAAIISREMKKPCVIGTKIATQVLKDGMKVEVDADNGIVSIIKRN